MHQIQRQLRNLVFCVLPALGLAMNSTGCEGSKKKDDKVEGKKKKKKGKEDKKKGKKKKSKKKDDKKDKKDKKNNKKGKSKDKKNAKNNKKKGKGKGKKKGSGKKKSRLALRAMGTSCVGQIESCTQDHAGCQNTTEVCKDFATTCLNALDLNCIPGVPVDTEVHENNSWVQGLATCITDPDMHDCVSNYDECVKDEQGAEKDCFQGLEKCMVPLFEEECSVSS